jgi:hypothetical protein
VKRADGPKILQKHAMSSSRTKTVVFPGVARRLKQSYGFEHQPQLLVKDLSVLKSLGLLVDSIPTIDDEAPRSEDDNEGVSYDDTSPRREWVASMGDEDGKVTGASVADSAMEIKILGRKSPMSDGNIAGSAARALETSSAKRNAREVSGKVNKTLTWAMTKTRQWSRRRERSLQEFFQGTGSG